MNSMDTRLCSRWSSFLLMGSFLIILGTLALSSVFMTTFASVMFFGVILAAGGLAYVFHAFWASEWKGFFGQLFLGILSAVIGWLMITNPAAAAMALTLLLAGFFLISGLFKTATALMVRVENWGWMLANGLITLALGILILAQWPSTALWVLGLFIAIDLLFSGWSNIMLAVTLRKACTLKNQADTKLA